MGCDGVLVEYNGSGTNFYSHIPCGMWPEAIETVSVAVGISTHTSRVGCDVFTLGRCRAWENFYSHIPCGMWRQLPVSTLFCQTFLLTHPVWDVTRDIIDNQNNNANFYSHIPCGMWLLMGIHLTCIGYFYSHIPCGMWLQWSADFYSHIPCGMWRLCL